jgi:serine/threonine protein kinase
MAPEVIQLSYTEKCDIWSAGVITFALYTGNFPFEGKTDDEVEETILKEKLEFNELQ